MKTMYRPCKGCRHRRVDFERWIFGDGAKFARCIRPEVQAVVTADEVQDIHLGGRMKKPAVVLCSTARESSYLTPETRRCGPDARYFEHKAGL